MTIKITNALKRSVAENMLHDIENNKNQYFFFIANSVPWSDENNPQQIVDSDKDHTKIRKNIIGYKKLNSKDILFAIPKVDWITDTIYDQYEYSNELFVENETPNFYVVNNNNIYKCLYNNGGSPSTDPPTTTQESAFTLGDGYMWKYMGTSSKYISIGNDNLIAVNYVASSEGAVNQYNTQIQAISGRISRTDTKYSNTPPQRALYPLAIVYRPDLNANDGLVVGSFYRLNSVYGVTSSVNITESASKEKIRSAISTSPPPLTFKDYIIRIVSNPGTPIEINNYGIIDSVEVIESGYRINILDDIAPFVVTPSSGNSSVVRAEILPYIKVLGDGFGAKLFPKMNGSPNNYYVDGVEVVDGGRDYSIANAYIFTTKKTTTGISYEDAILTPVLGPVGGHGSNIITELNAKSLIISVELSEKDNLIIPTGGSYRNFGIIKNPKLHNSSKIAGKDSIVHRDVTVINETLSQSSVFGNNLFSTNPNITNFLVGKESLSCSKIYKIKSYNNDTKRIVFKTGNSIDEFVQYTNRPNDFLLGLCASGVPFKIGEKIAQTVPAGTVVYPTGNSVGVSYGFGVVAEGIVIAIPETQNGYTLGIQATKNLFTPSNTNGITGDVSGSTAYIGSVTPRYGEYIFTGQKSQVTGVTVTSDKDLKILEYSSLYTEEDANSLYYGVHKLHINTSIGVATGGIDTTFSGLTPTTYIYGDSISQGSTSAAWNSSYSTGKVYSWEYKNPSYGILGVTDVFGKFLNVEDNGITGSNLGPYIVSSVDLPEISPLSGEIVYIDSIRAITRGVNQKEEFRFNISF